MVSGGTYGTEDIVHGAGYGRAILILLLTPLLWSLPTAFMIGELSSALPFEGGYYAWVRRAMGNFWGFQEAWLSLIASIFDMAIYPTLFVAYLTRMFPWFAGRESRMVVALARGVACALLNMAGVKVVSTTSLWLFFALSAPFVAIVLLSPFKFGALANAVTRPTTSNVDILGGLLICMWNYMGWDNASTIATEVERPQRTYPRAMLVAVAIVAVTYVLPFAAMWMTGLTASAWETGSWADIAGLLGGPLLRIAIVARRHDQRLRHVQCAGDELLAAAAGHGAGRDAAGGFRQTADEIARPWVAIIALAIGWAMCLGLGFAAPGDNRHPALRREPVAGVPRLGRSCGFREPELKRPFRVPGGKFGAMAIGIRQCFCWGFRVIRSEHESILGMSSFAFGMILIAAGVVAYALNHAFKPGGWSVAESKKPQPAA